MSQTIIIPRGLQKSRFYIRSKLNYPQFPQLQEYSNFVYTRNCSTENQKALEQRTSDHKALKRFLQHSCDHLVISLTHPVFIECSNGYLAEWINTGIIWSYEELIKDNQLELPNLHELSLSLSLEKPTLKVLENFGISKEQILAMKRLSLNLHKQHQANNIEKLLKKFDKTLEKINCLAETLFNFERIYNTLHSNLAFTELQRQLLTLQQLIKEAPLVMNSSEKEEVISQLDSVTRSNPSHQNQQSIVSETICHLIETCSSAGLYLEVGFDEWELQWKIELLETIVSKMNGLTLTI